MDSMNYFEKLASLVELPTEEELPLEAGAVSPEGPIDPAAAEAMLAEQQLAAQLIAEQQGTPPLEGGMPEASVDSMEPMTKRDAIDQAAHEASAVAHDALGDGAPPPTTPDELLEPDAAAEDQALIENLMLEREQIASYVEDNLVGFGTLARLYEVGHADDSKLSKSASTYLETMLTDEPTFAEGLDKMAHQLFGDHHDVAHLFSDEGLDYVTEHLAAFVEEPFEKLASDLEDAADGNTIVNKTKQAVGGFVESIQRLKGINQEISTLESKIQEARDYASQLETAGSISEMGDTALNLKQLQGQQADAINFRAKGYGLAGLGAGALAGGAYMAGRHFANQNQGEVVSQGHENGATLNAGNQHMLSENGGTYKMANTQGNVYLDNILKLAGAHFLIDGANNEQYGMEFNKQASEAFDSIASMSRADMDVAFAKVALENYSEDVLREIVAGTYTEEILEKTASVAAWDDLSADELVKIAGAGSVSAKGAAGALRDASEKVKNEIAIAKAQAEAEGRQYAGDTDKAGKVGGGLVGGLEGYNVINNPGAYEVAKTASQEDIEAAVLLKQAAYESYHEANEFLNGVFAQQSK